MIRDGIFSRNCLKLLQHPNTLEDILILTRLSFFSVFRAYLRCFSISARYPWQLCGKRRLRTLSSTTLPYLIHYLHAKHYNLECHMSRLDPIYFERGSAWPTLAVKSLMEDEQPSSHLTAAGDLDSGYPAAAAKKESSCPFTLKNDEMHNIMDTMCLRCHNSKLTGRFLLTIVDGNQYLQCSDQLFGIFFVFGRLAPIPFPLINSE